MGLSGCEDHEVLLNLLASAERCRKQETVGNRKSIVVRKEEYPAGARCSGNGRHSRILPVKDRQGKTGLREMYNNNGR